MSSRQYFGTDGIRGCVGKSAITPEFMLKLGWAAGQTFKQNGEQNKVIIGKDTRISGYMFESALEAGLSSAGVDVALLGPMPTPAIAYMTRTFRACAGIVISASHNPYYDNGIKFFSSKGYKLDDDLEIEIESWLAKKVEIVDSANLGKAFRVNDAAGRYVEYCKSTIPLGMSLKELKIVVDCANGATYQVAPSVFEELGANVKALGNKPNGLNINQDVGSTSPESLQKMVVSEGADLGIAFDGDGDRVLMVDHRGELLDGDELIYCIASHQLNRDHFGGGVVGTLMTNFGVESGYKKLGIPFVRANVGDRYVMEALLEKKWTLGGEGSGHIICLDKGTTGDGIVSSLQVLAAMIDQGKSLYEMKSLMKKMPQIMLNVKIRKRFDPMKIPEISAAVQKIEIDLNQSGRILLRASGTESLIRIMLEGEDQPKIKRLANELAEIVKSFMP